MSSRQQPTIDEKARDKKITHLHSEGMLSPDIKIIPLGSGGHNDHDSLSNFISALGVGGAVLALTPAIIHKIADLTGNHRISNILSELSGKCCPIIQKQSLKQGSSWINDKYGKPAHGISGALSAILAPVPGKIEDLIGIGEAVEKVLHGMPDILGNTLKRDEVKLAMMGGGLTLVSHAAGDFLGQLDEKVGKLAQGAMQLMGLTFMLPAVLPGVGHFVLTSSAILGLDEVDLANAEAHGPGAAIASWLGKANGDCWLEQGKAASGALSGGFMALCCALPAVLTALPALVNTITGKKQTTRDSANKTMRDKNMNENTPIQLYSTMPDEELVALRDEMMKQAESIKNPGLLKRLWSWTVKTTSAAAAFLLSFNLFDNMYLKEQEARVTDAAKEKPAKEPRSNYMRVATKDDFGKSPEKGERMVWSCTKCSCPSGMGGSCFPSIIKADHPAAPDYWDVKAPDLEIFIAANPNHPQQIAEKYRQDKKNYRNPDIKGVAEIAGLSVPQPVQGTSQQANQENAIDALKKQTVFATVTSVGAAYGAFELAKRMVDKPSTPSHDGIMRQVRNIEQVLLERQHRVAA